MQLPEPCAVAPEVEAAYCERGWWDGATLTSLLASALVHNVRTPVRFYSESRPFTGHVGDLALLARRFAAGLQARGVRPGDVVAFQLPSWAECCAVFYGASLAGAVLLPVPHFYGDRELRHALRETGARVLVIADRFRSRDHLEEVAALRPDTPALELVIVVGERTTSWSTPFATVLEAAPTTDVASPDPASVAAIAYTSGTSASPKGIMLSHRALAAETRLHIASVITPSRPLLMGSPLSHVSGMLVSALHPVLAGSPLLVTDVWDPCAVLRTMIEDQVSAGSGAAVFLTGLLDDPAFTSTHAGLIETAFLGGSPVPRALGERARALGITTLRAYGCTEQPTISSTHRRDPVEKRLATDGRPLTGVELRLGEDGEIFTRGPDLFSGYTDPALTAQALSHGWYATGDIGILDDEGYLTLTDRKKDIVIRGGENISAAEVEELLALLPAVAEVAVVAAPDERWGEHACAFVRLHAGGSLDLPQVQRHLAAQGLATKKWPEELRIITGDFARTSSGKIKKFVLRAELHSHTAP